MMEELQDAIEDAQYVNAIASQDDGPKPVTAWPKPTTEELEAWRKNKLVSAVKKYDKKDGTSTAVPFSMEWFLQQEIGLFLLSSFLKEVAEDYTRINFCEEVYRFKKSVGGRKTVTRARNIVKKYVLTPDRDPETNAVRNPSPTEIDEVDLYRPHPVTPALTSSQLKAAMEQNVDYPECSESAIGVTGSYRQTAVERLQEMEQSYGKRRAPQEASPQQTPEETPEAADNMADATHLAGVAPIKFHMFDELEAIVLESLKREYWPAFLESPQHKKLLDFLWYQDRPVVPDDFFPMRVLGRGGFGLVKGEF